MSRVQDLIRRIQDGEQAASEEFYRIYKPQLRRIIQARMRASGVPLRRLSDTSDLCQIVLASFLVGSAIGRYQLDDSGALRRLLTRIASRRVIDLARKPEFRIPTAAVGGAGADGIEPVAPGLSPESQVALHELIQKADRLLTETERPVAELRKEGLTWEEIGHRLGKSADAVRMALDRAVRRIMLALGMEDSGNE